MGKIITLSVEEEIERKFRELASIEFGKKKGYLGKAMSVAMKEWIERKERESKIAKVLELMKKGIDMGGIKYKKRDELHER